MEKNLIYSVQENIKLELNNGTLTLKAGSKVYIPNGSGVFDLVNIQNDITTTDRNDGQKVVFVNTSGYSSFIKVYASRCISGNYNTMITGTNYCWYDTLENKVKYYGSHAGVISAYTSFPIAVITVSGGNISSIDKIFNGFGYMGSALFVLPDVSGYVPNGRDLNGDLSFIPASTNKVLIKNGYNGQYAYLKYGNGEFNDIALSQTSIYNDTANIFLNNVGQTLFYYNYSPLSVIDVKDNIKTLSSISQYANSRNYMNLFNGLTYLFNNARTIEDWFNVVYNLNTAEGFGLDIWGKILNQGRQFSYDDDGTTVNVYLGGEQTIGGITYSAEYMENMYRTVLFLKALSNVTNCSLASLNNLLQFYYKNRGMVYVMEYPPMEIKYIFEFYVSDLEKAIFTTGIIPRPTGVGVSFEFIPDGDFFGFFANVGTGEEQPFAPFNNKPFYR